MTEEQFKEAAVYFQYIQKTRMFIQEISPYARPDRKRKGHSHLNGLDYMEEMFFSLSPVQVENVIRLLEADIQGYEQKIKEL